MGLDRFANFISKSICNESIEEINIDNNLRKIVANHIIFDLNFLIYQEIIDVENEINDILKVILCLPFSLSKNITNGSVCYSKILENILKNIFTQKHWNPYYTGTDLESLLDGFNEDEIIHKFVYFITNKISSSISDNNDEILSIIELVVYEKIANTLTKYIENIHHPGFIQSLFIFYDGIPSFSKVIEQRRRRIKNFIESNEKKILFKKYFETLLPNNKNLFDCINRTYTEQQYINEIILFDYFKWVKNRFSIDKSIGPSSSFIKNLETFMEIKLKQRFPKLKIYINSAKENGESDLKIFKYISLQEINGDYSIHTTDSDLIHQVLVQQTYYKIINKDINLTLVKYLKNYNNQKSSGLLGYAQVFEANLIIKNMMDLYNTSNNIKTNNYKIIWDLCLIFYLFGNDHLPSSLEIGPELGLDFYVKKHYQSLSKSNVVNLKKNYITMDLSNLKLYLEKINESNVSNVTRIFLQRFFKINTNFVTLLVDKLNLNFQQILSFLEVFITNIGLSLDEQTFDSLDESDLRRIFVKSNKGLNYESLGFNESKIKIITDNSKLIEENIDFYENEFNGLVLYNKPLIITNDSYQDLYNYITEKATSNLNKKYPNYYDHLDITEHNKILGTINNNTNSYNYLKKIYHLVISQFGNMKDFHSDNLTWYPEYSVPSVSNLVQFILESSNGSNITKKWLQEIKEDNVEPKNYLNSINHHLIITPFISFYNPPSDIKEIINELKQIDDLWFDDVSNFNYKKIDIKDFLKKWDDAIIRINLNLKTNKINGEIISTNSFGIL